MSAVARFRESKASPLRAPKSASREIFSESRRAARRKPAYAPAVSRKNRRRYDEARQDRQSLQTDPVGYEDDLNLYMYVSNDPLNLTDPTGREGESIQMVANAFRRMFSFSEEPQRQPQSVGGALAPVADPAVPNATVQAGVQVSGSAATYTGQVEIGVAASTQGEVGAYATTSTGRTSDVIPTAGIAGALTTTNAGSLADLRGSSTTTSAGGVIGMGEVNTSAPDGSPITGTTLNLGVSTGEAPAVTHTDDTTRMIILNERK